MDSIASDSPTASRYGSAFHELTGPLPSPSPTVNNGLYDVFINHCGKDVKVSLASSIYYYLDNLKVRAFLDLKEIESGDSFPEAIENAMRSAPIHIAIFSRNYAKSPWCLKELLFMFEIKAQIIPVFYDVQPSDLRWIDPQGTYGRAFQEHEASGRYNSATLEKWKTALKDVSYVNGAISRSDHEVEGALLNRIGNRVQQLKIKRKLELEVPLYAVGLDDAVKEFEDTIGHESVQIVGIAGMSGCGKTTLAQELYNRKFRDFNNCTFLSEVKEFPLHKLQKKLLRDLAHSRYLESKNAIELKPMLTACFKSLFTPVLIVLDDVDHSKQLNALLPDKRRMLKSGSLIIVTTCDLGILESWGISSVYKMRELDRPDAEKLFCLHAFKQPSPRDGFHNLVRGFVIACEGLPLSLKVIGEMLYGQPKEKWEYNSTKISRLTKGIEERLKLSYDALDEEEKAIFLDIACFFVGEKKNLAIAVWDVAGWRGLENLENKCLVEVHKNRIRMHNHLRDLGRKIAIDYPPHRLWSAEQIMKIIRSMRSKQERPLIRGIMAATTQFVACRAHDELPVCCNHYPPVLEEWMDFTILELLVVNGVDFTPSGFANRSEKLLWLRLFDFEDRDLPSWLSVENLRVLELCGASGLQLWENNAQLPEGLIELNITAKKGNIFNNFPSKNISRLKDLKKIALISEHGEEFCFQKLPDGFCNLQSLEHLELRYCKQLSSLPNSFGELKRLRHLDLCSCEKLRKLPESFKELVSLEYLDLSGCKSLAPERNFLQNTRTLKNLYLSGCSIKWRELPQHLEDQKSMRELHLQNTTLRELPNSIGKLRELETLGIGSTHFRNLPPSIGDLSSLTNLKITGCTNLEFLPPSIDRLIVLEKLCLETSGVKSLPEGFTRLASLHTLEISDCPIAELDFSSATSSLGKLKAIYLKATAVTRLSISQGCCPCLETLQLEQNFCLMELEILTTSIKTVKVDECPIGNLDLGAGSSSLDKLKAIHLKATHLTRLSISQDCCPNLETLQLEQNCSLLELEILISIKTVQVHECKMLHSINGVPHRIEIKECPKLDAAVRSFSEDVFMPFEESQESGEEVKLEVYLE